MLNYPTEPLEDYQDRTDLSPSLEFIRLIVSDKEQTISRAKDLAERLDKVDVEGLDLIETILVYKLPDLSREEIKQMLSVYEVKLQDTRFYQEVSAEGEQIGEQKECIILIHNAPTHQHLIPIKPHHGQTNHRNL